MMPLSEYMFIPRFPAHVASLGAKVGGTASGKLTITAKGGPVSDYSITVGPALAGKLTVSPSSGSLAAGASATVTVTSTSLSTSGPPYSANCAAFI